MSYPFPSDERLKSARAISGLFAPGSASVAAFPVRAVYRTVASGVGEPAVRVAFVVPKKKFRRAVDRNLLKRRMREAYRLQRGLLAGTQVQYASEGKSCHLLLMFTAREALPYDQIARGVRKVLQRMDRELAPGGRSRLDGPPHA